MGKRNRKRIVTIINGGGKRTEIINKTFDGTLFRTHARCVLETSQSFEEAVTYVKNKRHMLKRKDRVAEVAAMLFKS